jgi:hypothetical protein
MPTTTIPGREPSEHPDTPAPVPSGPTPVDEDEILDWDAHVEVPPPRRSGTVRVLLKYAGRGRPLPVDDPAAE